jgi:hypothetical protein
VVPRSGSAIRRGNVVKRFNGAMAIADGLEIALAGQRLASSPLDADRIRFGSERTCCLA